MLRERADGQYEFDHDKIREVLYAELSALQRKRWHARVAQSLERLEASSVEDLAHHFLQAGVWDKALAYHVAAGRRATERYTYDQALPRDPLLWVAHFNLGLVYLEADRPDLARAVGHSAVLIALGRLDEAEHLLQAALLSAPQDAPVQQPGAHRPRTVGARHSPKRSLPTKTFG